MSPAVWPRERPLDERMLVLRVGEERYEDARVGDLGRYLGAGDLLVVNDAATLPASLAGTCSRGPIEVRLLAHARGVVFRAVLFGEGDWRARTEDRPPPPALLPGDRLTFSHGLAAHIDDVSHVSPRLVTLSFESREDALWPTLFRAGRPVQYSYLAGPLEVWHAETRYAARPWAVELPSAGRPLTWQLLASLERRGIAVATLTHAAGLSSTGNPAINRLLPFPERYDIPDATVAAVARARRVVAVGTTVARALEGCFATHGAVVAGEGETDLVIGEAFRPRVVRALFTGLHDPSASHFQLLQAFAPRALIEAAYAHAERAGYVNHEFGDSSLIA